jgi:adenylate cyclase
VWTAVALASLLPEWRKLDLAWFDLLTVVTAPDRVDLPIVIVGIDEPSFAELHRQWPWPRSLHGRLIEQLKRAGAAVIAVDVVFAEPSDPAEDRRFADSIRAAGNVVLAGDLAVQETPQFRQVMRVEPLEILQSAAAATGISSITVDSDLVVRQVPSRSDAFWRQILRVYRRDRSAAANSGAVFRGALLRYLGRDHWFPYVSYYQALEPDALLPQGTFRDRIVLVGLDIKASPEPGAARADMFATPFLAFTGWLTPGVEIQANFLANALFGRAIHEVPASAPLGLTAGALTLAILGARRWRPLAGGLQALGLAGLLGAGSWWLFAFRDTWLPILAPVSALLLMYTGQAGLAFATERRRRRQIKHAFRHYVSPQVVEEILAHPEKLVLGGVRRDLTLLFTDLAGFTSVSEKLSPEQVAQVLNSHLTAMTRIVLAHGGTVDKFIGDAIMAFWGAPLEDPEQALHACQAAWEMQEEMKRLRRAHQDDPTFPSIGMRIGVHSGCAVVGNMGSLDRFDYTAVGDNVNLASRLEGVNKLYGTEVLLSAATAEQLRGRIPLRLVDKVRVKGKTQPIEVYSFAMDPTLGGLDEQAIAAYRRQQWDQAESVWHEVLQRVPGDGIAQVYLKRITALRNAPPGADWDGSVALDKM